MTTSAAPTSTTSDGSTSTTPDAPTTTRGVARDVLPNTGYDPAAFAVFGALAIALGLGILAAARERELRD